MNHEIIQFAAIASRDRKVLGNINIYARPKFPERAESGAMKAHGISLQEMKDLPKQEASLKKLQKFIYSHKSENEKFILVAYNLDFDKQFLRNWLMANDYYALWYTFDFYKEVCVLRLAKIAKALGLLKSTKNRLSDICKELNVKLENAHDALVDINATKEVYFKLIDLLTHYNKGQEQIRLF